MLNKLTPEQEALMKTVRDERLNQFFQLKPIDKEKCEKHIEFMYKLAKLKKPAIIYLDSPMGAQLAIPYTKKFLEILKHHKENDGL